MVIHNPDEGRSGIYASETIAGDSNPRIVNATLVGRSSTSVNGTNDETASQVGILFADNTDQIRMANVAIVNFTNGCYIANDGADLSGIDTTIPGPTYLDGVHCVNNNGGNGGFGIVRSSAVAGFPAGTVAPNNSNGDGLVYYNGGANPARFSGVLSDLSASFTASWYLNDIGDIGNGLIGNPNFLNGFLDGDTNNDGTVDAADNGSPFIIADDSAGTGFNQDVADDTGGYDLTHVGASRSGNPSNAAQFDGWTVATGAGEGFVVMQPGG